MKKKLVPIRFPPNLEEMLDTGKAALTKMLGGACSAMAQSAASQDLIPNSNTHNCPAGLRLESRLR
jgi:hypothetical protein